MILIAGGTGCLGSVVANRLHQRGVPVRVLSRGLTPHPGTLDPGVDFVRADVRDPASLALPMEGAELVVSAVQGFMGPEGVTPTSVDRDGNIHLIEAAECVGADFVMVSVIGASPESPMALMRAKFDAEQRLRSSGLAWPGLAWPMVRPEAYAETWARGGLGGACGRRRQAARPGPRDLRSRASDPDAAGGDDHGPAPLDRKARHVPRPALHAMANTVGLLKPGMALQARAALAMDELPTTSDTELRNEFPDLPCTPVSHVVAALQGDRSTLTPATRACGRTMRRSAA